MLSGCNGQGSNETDQNNQVAIVNGEGILEDDFKVQLAELKEMAEMQGINLEEDPDTLAELENQALETLISKTLLLQETKNKGIEVSQTEIDKNIDEIKSGFEDDAQFQEALVANGLEIEELADLIKEDLLMQALLAEIAPNTSTSEDEITDQEINDFYEQQKQMAEAQGMEIPPLEEVKPDIVAFIKQQKEQVIQQQALEGFLAEAREKSKIEVLL